MTPGLKIAGASAHPCTELRGAIMDEVIAERYRQLEKWGEQRHPDMTDDGEDGWSSDSETVLGRHEWFKRWADSMKADNDEAAERGSSDWTGILLEEVYEALAEEDWSTIRAELIQTMAVCAAWIEDGDTRE